MLLFLNDWSFNDLVTMIKLFLKTCLHRFNTFSNTYLECLDCLWFLMPSVLHFVKVEGTMLNVEHVWSAKCRPVTGLLIEDQF